MISSDQWSPKISKETLTGQPDLRLDLDLPGTAHKIIKGYLQYASKISETNNGSRISHSWRI
jgi:hypothetical protein